MQTFYHQLFAQENRLNPYFKDLRKLTHLTREKIATLKSALYWNGWSAAEG